MTGGLEEGGTHLHLIDLNSEFDALETGAFFINSSQGIGVDFAQSGANGPSIFPVTSLALRTLWQVSDRGLVRAAVIDAVPGAPDDPDKSSLHLSSSEGALLVAETDWQLSKATRGFTGMWGYTQEADVLDSASGAQARAWGLYGALESEFAADFFGYVRVGWANPQVHMFETYVGSGVVWSGLSEDLDVGMALGWAHTGPEYRAAERAVGHQAASHELKLEFSVRLPLTEWLTLQPDVQWIRHPGASRDLKDALAIGLRFEATWEVRGP